MTAMDRAATHRRRAPRQRMAAVGLVVLGLTSLSAAGWLTAAPQGDPAEPPPAGAGPPTSEGVAEDDEGRTEAQPPPPRSTSPPDPERQRTAPSSGASRSPEQSDAPPVTAPASVEVPSLGVRSELIDLGLDEDRRLEVPTDPDLAGWWVGGPRPGEHGPAVIAGHVDSLEGPAIFWRLHELEPGDRITVHDEQGASYDFAVDRVGRWPKDDFPTDEVYRQADGPELRLITCGGAFDDRAGSYRDNVIVFATAVA